MMWNTKLQQLCQIPIVGAPMAGHSGGRLAAAVSNAGGIGFIGGGHSLFSDDKMTELEQEIEIYQHRTLTTTPSDLPLYVGFIGHSSLLDTAGVDRYKAFLKKHRPKIVQFFAPAIKKNNVQITQEHGSLFWAQVGSFRDAQEAIRAGVDGLILQGSEAGGHGLRKELGNATLPLVSTVLKEQQQRNIPIIAAGGIVDASTMACMMMLGCDGVVLGTRLWASHEALDDKRYSLAKPDLTCDDIVRTELFDAIQNTYSPTPWPEPYDSVGAVRNETYQNFRDAKFNESDVAFYRKHIHDPKIGLVHAGEGVGLISSILPASEIVSSINEGAMELIRSAPRRLFE